MGTEEDIRSALQRTPKSVPLFQPRIDLVVRRARTRRLRRYLATTLVAGIVIIGAGVPMGLLVGSVGDRLESLPPDVLELYAVNADGSGLTRLTHNASSDDSPAWSPDGRQIAFVSAQRGQEPDIYVMNADGSGRTRLTHNEYVDGSPAWSPDGRYIAFVRHLPNEPQPFENSEIFVMQSDGSGEVRLTRNHLRDESPVWSPDSSRIAFLRGDGGLRVHVMAADGSDERPITGDISDDPTWSPDGTRIAFVSFGEPDPDFEEIHVVSADGTGQRALTDYPGSDHLPAWSPTGSHIAWSRDGEVWLMRPDGSEQTRITSGRQGAPIWSPDGAWILVVRFVDAQSVNSELFLIRPDGSDETRLTNYSGPDEFPAWSPDGTRIVFTRAEGFPEL